MLHRQKVLIEIISSVCRPVTKYELIKWCFLLANEYPSKGGNAFYRFLPFHYGPYSFLLSRDLEILFENNYLTACTGKIGLHQIPIEDMENDASNDIPHILNAFMNCSKDQLRDYVYNKYPWFTANSRVTKLASRPLAKTKIYTIGYEGLNIDALLNLLLKKGISKLVDVRNNPVSRVYGYHKKTLSLLCRKVGINYLHVPELGILSSERRKVTSEQDLRYVFDNYKKTVLSNESESAHSLAKEFLEEPCVLLCMEADHNCCHRSILANIISDISGLSIEHIMRAHE